MDEYPLKPGWGSHTFLAGRARLGGEADGPRERELKQKLTEFIRSDFKVKRAYLARIQYVSESKVNMALCLKMIYGGENTKLVEQLFEIYAKLYYRSELMDLIFLTDEQEERLALTCAPFYGVMYDGNRGLLPDTAASTGIVCSHCASGQSRILHAFRTAAFEKGDSGWQFYCKCGMPENIADAKVLPLKEIVKLEPSLRGWLETPIGMNLWRLTAKARWEQIKEDKLNGNGHGANGHSLNENGQNGSIGHGSNGVSGHYSVNGRNGHGGNGESNNIGNGMFSPNGEVNFVREHGRPFDRGMAPQPPSTGETPVPPEDTDPIREYIKLKPGWPHPVEIALYYECLGCGEVLSSASAGEAKCRCGNIAISSGVIKIENLAKASAFRQR